MIIKIGNEKLEVKKGYVYAQKLIIGSCIKNGNMYDVYNEELQYINTVKSPKEACKFLLEI